MRFPVKHMVAVAGVMVTMAMTSGCPDPCATQGPEARSAEVGTLSGAATFEPLAPGATVEFGSAPQGGQGVFTAIRTTGLESHLIFGLISKQLDMQVRIVDNTSGSRDVLGDFPTNSFFSCVDDEFGVATDVAFGLDGDRFGSGFGDNPEGDEAFAALDGRTVTLEADLTDDNGATFNTTHDVVLDTQ